MRPKDGAASEKVPVDRMMSNIAGRALAPESAPARSGVLIFDARPDAPLVTLTDVNRLRDEDLRDEK